MGYKAQLRIDTIKESTIIMPDGFSGWRLQNTGLWPITAMGITIDKGEVLDYLSLQPNVIWDTPINVVIPNVECSAVLHRIIYRPTND